MNIIIIDKENYFSIREGEEKIGERIKIVQSATNWQKEIEQTSARFVILGIPEDIGVRANFGRPGAYSAFNAFLKSFLSMQHNRYLNAEEIMLLGTLNINDLMEQSKNLNPKIDTHLKQLRELVKEIDQRVSSVLNFIFQNNKIPIIIGGGHNNSYPIIESAYYAFHQKINIINCDAHSDLREMEGRHSGNAFRYAFERGFIQHYHVLGLHEQYTSENIFQYIRSKTISFYTYEDIFIREKISFNEALKNSIYIVNQGICGLELDMDAITNVPSSARTSSGISPIDARKYVYTCANELNCVYLHLAEGAPETAHLRADYKTGKLLAYLTCDFIKGINEKHHGTAR